jgi:hypothetical protein
MGVRPGRGMTRLNFKEDMIACMQRRRSGCPLQPGRQYDAGLKR